MEFGFKIDDNIFEVIKKFGSILGINENILNFRFTEGTNYKLTNNGKIATRNEKRGFDCAIIGNRKIPKNKIIKWKLKINSGFKKEYLIGIGPKSINNENNFYVKC